MRLRLAAIAAAFTAVVFVAPARAELLIKVDKSTQQMTVTRRRRSSSTSGRCRPASPATTRRPAPYTPFRMEKDHLQPRVGRRADALFDLLHHEGPRHPRHQPHGPRPPGLARLRAAVGGACRHAVGAGRQAQDGQHQGGAHRSRFPAARARQQWRAPGRSPARTATSRLRAPTAPIANQGDNQYVNQDPDQYGTDQDGDQSSRCRATTGVRATTAGNMTMMIRRHAVITTVDPMMPRPRGFFPFPFGR